MSAAAGGGDASSLAGALRGLLAGNLAAAGFYGYGFLSRAAFHAVLDRMEVPAEVRRKYTADDAASVAVAALRYGEGAYAPPAWAEAARAEDEPKVGIARFARANWYRELSSRLESAAAATVAQALEAGIGLPPAKAWRRLVNSGLPEKPAAVMAGLGWIGRNGIVVAAKGEDCAGPSFSSAVTLGLLFCPVDLEPPDSAPLAPRCGQCRRCLDACPTGALGWERAAARDGNCAGEPARERSRERARERAYSRERCIQHWTAKAGELPSPIAEALDGRLYGCDSCLEACPYFLTDPSAETSLGRLGPALPARCFPDSDDAMLRRALKGSALDRSWMSMEAFRRNARLAIGRGSRVAR